MSLKNKKVACFIGLPHHARFLWPITNALQKEGAQVLHVTSQSYYPYEKEIVKKGGRFVFVQTAVSESLRKKVFSIKREFFKVWSKKNFEWEGLNHWPLMNQYVHLKGAIEESFYMEAFIQKENPDLLLTLHEKNRWGKILGHLSHKLGIPLVTLQEGDLYDKRMSYVGHAEYSTALLLWGRDVGEHLSRLGAAADKFVVTGNTHLNSIQKEGFLKETETGLRARLNIPNERKIVLFLVGFEWGQKSDESFWDNFLKESPPGVVCVFKWHPVIQEAHFNQVIKPLFERRFPHCRVTLTENPYQLINLSDYCVTLGKTTLAVEAVSFGKPLFSLPDEEGGQDIYAPSGISQPLVFGNFEPLNQAIKRGVPDDMSQKGLQFLENHFYQGNRQAIERATKVIEHICDVKDNQNHFKPRADFKKDVLSFILPSGSDPKILLNTLTSLKKISHHNSEIILVVQDPSIKGAIPADAKNIVLVEEAADFFQKSTASEARGNHLASLYNRGFESSSGKFLIFMKPGVLFEKEGDFIEAIKKGVAGMPLMKNSEPHCFGFEFDFNYVPQRITRPDAQNSVQAIGGGIVGLTHNLFNQLGGFDEGIADQFVEIDLCLSALQKGVSIEYCRDGLGIIDGETIEVLDEWKGKIRFFAKWVGKLPKNDDFLSFIRR